MVRSKLLLTTSVLLGLVGSVFAGNAASALSATCSSAAAVAGICTSAQTNNNSIDVWARNTTPGGSTAGVVPAGRTDGVRKPRVTPYYFPSSFAFKCLALSAPSPECRRTPVAPAVAPVTYAPIALTDLANFVPQAASISSQPRGWTVVNLNTNFIAAASTHVVTGSLFGRATEVRFTPHAYDWNYGDGATQTTGVPGARWDSLGLREFAPTATSHVYAAVGTYSTTVAVRYGAEYRVGGGSWIPVTGEVTSAATTAVTIAQSADTVLVARECTAGRTAAGC